MREIPPGTVCRNYRVRPPSPDPADETVKRIPLSGGPYAYVDAADYERLSRYKWRVCAGYAARYEKGRAIFMYHQIIQPPKGMVVDHRNGNRLDNCARNLRACTRGGGGRNSVAACSRRVRTAPLSSLTGLAFVLGPGSPAINRWAILYRPAGLDFASVLLRRPVRPTGAIDTSPPFQRWVPIANHIPKPRRGERRLGCALVSAGIRSRHRMPTAPTRGECAQ